MGALLALAQRAVAPLARRFAGRGLARIAGTTAVIAGGTGIGNLLFDGSDGGGITGDGVAPRRRRRRALTSDDMKTALTIASAISKKAAENFILMRVRGS